MVLDFLGKPLTYDDLYACSAPLPMAL